MLKPPRSISKASERLRQALNEREVRSVTAYNAARERYEAAEAAGQIARELLDEEREQHARTMEQWNALVAALSKIAMTVHQHSSSGCSDMCARCLAESALARVEPTR